MPQHISVNYNGTFEYADDLDDHVEVENIQGLGKAFEDHDHSGNHGLPASRIKFDVAANRPVAAAALSGQVFLATDTSVFSVCDGAAWHSVDMLDLVQTITAVKKYDAGQDWKSLAAAPAAPAAGYIRFYNKLGAFFSKDSTNTESAIGFVFTDGGTVASANVLPIPATPANSIMKLNVSGVTLINDASAIPPDKVLILFHFQGGLRLTSTNAWVLDGGQEFNTVADAYLLVYCDGVKLREIARSSPTTFTQGTALGADVALTLAATWYDVMSLNLGVGTHHIDVNLVGQDMTNGWKAKLTDGSTIAATATSKGGVNQLVINEVVTLTAAATWKVQAQATDPAEAVKANATGAGNYDSRMRAVRLK